jgi:beta-fructofuranosidase
MRPLLFILTSTALAAEPVLRLDMAETQGCKPEGAVALGISLTQEELAASQKRGGDGKLAHFSGGRLVGEKAGRVLQTLSTFTFAVRLKPEGESIRGTVCVQRGAREAQSGAFELSGWHMPFIERDHLTFQGMFRDGLTPRTGKYFPAINIDQDRYSSNGWRDIVITKAKGGTMQWFLDGKRIAVRERASIVPGVSAWAFEGAASPLCIGADADGGQPFRGWIDHVMIWDRVLDEADIAAFSGVERIVDAVVPQPAEERIFGNGILTADTPVEKRYDWVDARLPAFRNEIAKTDPHLPHYHITLPGEMWNPIAWFHGGKYHLFQGWSSGGCFGYFEDTSENIVWQHLMSSDLIHWTLLPMPIRSPLYPNENGTFFRDDAGRVIVHYYGARGSEPRMAVTRDPDLATWKSFPQMVRFHGIPEDLQGRHDPAAVFKQGDTWFQISTTVRPKAAGLVLPLYQSKDLIRWDYAGRFFEDATGRSVNECGQLFQLDGRHVFTAIHDLSDHAQYMTGTLRTDGSFERQHAGIVDYASSTYNCVSTAVNDAGRATQWRFMNIVRPYRQSSAAGWWNTLSLPRDLRVDAQGRLLPRPSPSLEKLRARHVHHDITSTTFTLENFAAASSETRLQFNRASITLRLSDGTRHLEARYDQAKSEMTLDLAKFGQGIRRAPVTPQPGQPITLRFFADRSIFELYANDEVVISAAAFFTDPAALQIQITADAPVTLDAWEMKPLEWSAK